MNSNLYNPKRLIPNLQISHIKVPEFQITANGSQIIKAKRIQVQPLKTQPRSLSAQCNFRNVFQTPKSNPNKENILKVSTSVPKGKEKGVRYSSQCRVIKEMSQKLENNIRTNLASKRESCEVRGGLRVVPRIRLVNVGKESVERDDSLKRSHDDLVTFRPAKRENRFPRDVFCIDSRRK